ncbi:MAG: hypothetical protein R3B70_09755 [Polyangiaceae bacterium]
MAEMVRTFPRATGPEDAPQSASGAQPGPGTSGEASTSPPEGPAKEMVSGVAHEAQQAVSARVSRRAERSAVELEQVARALRKTREDLGGNTAAPYVDKAAAQLERLSRYMRTTDAREMLRGVESFARREPLVFLGGAFAIGMLGARFLKSSAHHEPHGDDGGSPRRPA